MRNILFACALLVGTPAVADILDDLRRLGDNAKTIADTIRDDVRSGLSELVPPRDDCGSNGQRHCTFRERPLAKCDFGLLTHPFDVCFKPKNEDRAENITRGGNAGPKEIARELWELAKDLHEAFNGPNIKAGMIKDLIEELKPAVSAITDAIRAGRFDKAALGRIAQSVDVEALQRILEETPKLVAAYGSLRAAGFDTLTMGDSIGIGLLRGIQGEAGISLDTRQRRVGTAYAARTDSKGPQAFAGNDVVFSAYDSTQNCDVAGTAYGYGVSVDVKAGFGLVIWYDRFGEFIGFSTAIGAGSIGGGLAGLKTETVTFPKDCPAEPEDGDGSETGGVEPQPDPEPVPEPEPEPEPLTITVVRGDTLWDLARTHLGAGNRYPEIVALNDAIKDPDLIYPGQIFVLPPNT